MLESRYPFACREQRRGSPWGPRCPGGERCAVCRWPCRRARWTCYANRSSRGSHRAASVRTDASCPAISHRCMWFDHLKRCKRTFDENIRFTTCYVTEIYQWWENTMWRNRLATNQWCEHLIMLAPFHIQSLVHSGIDRVIQGCDRVGSSEAVDFGYWSLCNVKHWKKFMDIVLVRDLYPSHSYTFFFHFLVLNYFCL